MKRIIALLLALSLVLTLSVTAFAEGPGGSPPGDPPSGESGSMGDRPDGDPPGDPPNGSGGMGGGPGGGPGGSSGVESYDAVIEYSEDTHVSGESYTSTGTDENAILVSGGTVTLTELTVDRTSSDSTGGDNSSFYGVGAAILATGGTAVISGAEITTDSAGGAGAFAYGDGVVVISDSTIHTAQNTSGGIHAAGGGTLYAYDLDVTTEGGSAAAIRSDRGGGTMVVDGGTYTSNGTGSPAIYCTADIAVNNATLTAANSEAVCIEGLNSLYLYDSDLSGDIPENEQNDCDWNVILYQSMSGDSEVGNSTFQMVGGSLTAKNGGMFYTTNTQSTFLISGVDITYADENDFFLKVTGNANQRGWGSSGANGAQCSFTAIDQEMEGNVIWDSISTLDLYLENSTLTGAIVDDESNAGSGGDGCANVYLSEDSTWVVTGNSTVTNLYAAGKIVDDQGSAVTITGTDGTVYVKGASSYTVTAGSYSDTADLSGASSISDWSEHQADQAEAAEMAASAASRKEESGAASEPPQEDAPSRPEDSQQDGQPGNQPQESQSETVSAAETGADASQGLPNWAVAAVSAAFLAIAGGVIAVATRKKGY